MHNKPTANLDRKIKNMIKVHMYNKGVVHFELWKDEPLIKKIFNKYHDSERTNICDIYMKMGFKFTLGKEREAYELQMDLYKDVLHNHLKDCQNFSEDKNYEEYVSIVLRLSFYSGKSFESILKIFTELDSDVVTYYRRKEKDKIKMELMDKLNSED